MTRLPLRLRMLLFFAFLASSGALLVWAALWSVRAEADTAALIRVAVVAGFGLFGLNTLVWLLFDENVARPIDRLAQALRAQTHAGVDIGLTEREARFLGDLAPATQAASAALATGAEQKALDIAAQTARLEADRNQLVEILSEIPLAVMLCDADGQLMLYDGQAAALLSLEGPLRLGAPLGAYFAAKPLRAALAKVAKTGQALSFCLEGRTSGQSFDLNLTPLSGGEVLATLSPDETAPRRPMVFDFVSGQTGARWDTPLSQLVVTVLDTETTGLLPHRDEIVQVGAVRIRAGQVVAGEEIDQLVDPGCAIPASATKVHRVTDAMVEGQPDIIAVGRRLHRFAEGSVIAAHNAPFDMAFLRRYTHQMGVDWDHPVLDTVLVSAVLFGIGADHGLDALCQRLRVEVTAQQRHTALGDAKATAACWQKMSPMLEAKGILVLGDLIEASRQHSRLLKDLN